MLPTDFDFSVLDDPSFKEDAVREEVVAPILRKLGYLPSGEVRVERSKTLLHPYVMIGTKKHKVNIIPDYTLFSGARPLMILDAKRPTENITDSTHVEQAYSYAIHPEVRCDHFGLCNGRELVVFEVATLEQVLKIDMVNVNARWNEVAKVLHHSFLAKPILRHFLPDFGIHAQRAGFDLSDTGLLGFHIDLLSKQTEATFSASCGCCIGDDKFMVTFDFSLEHLAAILSCLPAEKRQEVEKAFQINPFGVVVAGKVAIDVGAKFGRLTQGEHEPFVPLEVTTITRAVYQPDFKYSGSQTDFPSYFYRL